MMLKLRFAYVSSLMAGSLLSVGTNAIDTDRIRRNLRQLVDTDIDISMSIDMNTRVEVDGKLEAKSGKGGKSSSKGGECVPTPEDAFAAFGPYDPRGGDAETASNAFLDCDLCIPEDGKESICFEDERGCDGTKTYNCRIDDKCYYPPLKKALFTETGAGKCIEHDGLDRCWLIHIPKSFCERDGPTRLVVDIHGRGGTAYGWRALRNGWLEKAEDEGFVVVWPQSAQDFRDPSVYSGFDPIPSYNSGGVSTMNTNINRFEENIRDRGCCDPAITLGTDDVGFLRKMVEDVTAEYDIDNSRVYWTGISNGCSMSQTMAAVVSTFDKQDMNLTLTQSYPS